MAVFKCKMCGGTLEINENQSVAVCEYCGTQQTISKSADENIQNLFNRANNLRIRAEFDKAQEIYEKIVNIDSTDAEAYWGIVLCKYGVEYVEDPSTFKRIPTCHRTQIESVISDVDYHSALTNADEKQKAIYEAEAKEIERLQKNILSIVNNEDPFDVFICYKETDENGKRTNDSVIANDIYHQLTQEGFKVFYAAITLEDKLGQEYEPYIFSALNSAKVMLVVGSKPEYFNAVWVKNEWSRYLKIIKNDRSKLLIPCYKDMDAYDLPEEFSHLQAQDMSKIGFISDIVRGIKKTINSSGDVSKKDVVAEGSSSVNSKVLVDRALLAIEDGDIKKAEDLLDEATDKIPTYAMIHICRLLIEFNIKKISDLAKINACFCDSKNYQRAIQFADEQLKKELEGYVEQAEIARKDKILEEANKKKALKFLPQVEEALKLYESISGWKDADTSIEECKEKIERLKAEEAKRIEAARIAGEKRKEQTKKAIKIITPIALVLIVIIIIYAKVIAPANSYKKANEQLANNNYEVAYEMLEDLGDYKDSAEILAKSRYDRATALLNEEKYQEAYDMFVVVVGSYSDAPDKANEAYYELGKIYLADKNYDMSNPIFEELGNYKDSAELTHYHNYEVVDSKDATCTADGYKTYKCKGCGHSYTEEIKTSGHSYSAATCTEPQKCTKCGETSGSALGHTTDGVICSRCGKSTFETLTYSGSGFGVVNNLNLPQGRFKITCRSSKINTDDGGNCFVHTYYENGNEACYFINPQLSYSTGPEETATDSKAVDGPFNGGRIEIDTADHIKWTITIEAIG